MIHIDDRNSIFINFAIHRNYFIFNISISPHRFELLITLRNNFKGITTL